MIKLRIENLRRIIAIDYEIFFVNLPTTSKKQKQNRNRTKNYTTKAILAQR